jgi:hypothetical protein
MDQIIRVVRYAALRLAITRSLHAFAITLTGAFVLLLGLRIAQRLIGFELAWGDVFLGVGVAAVFGAIAWAYATRDRDLASARALDEAADLRESLSTAMCVASDPVRARDPWAQLIVRAASERAEGVDVRRAIPIRTPEIAPIPACAGVVLAIVWFTMPQFDLTGKLATRAQADEEQRQIQEVRSEFEEGQKKLEELLSKANVDLEEGEGEDAKNDREAPKTIEEARRDQVRRLTDMSERLEQLRQGEKNQAMDAIKDRLGRLRSPGEGELNDLYRAMARSNFGQAQKDLEALANKMAENSGLSPEERENLRKQLEQMSGQLSKLATEQGDLAKSLEQMGMDGRLAADPEALKRAIEQAKQNGELTPEQQKQLEQMQKQAEAQQRMAEAMGNMADAMAKMAKGASDQGMNGEGMQGLEQLGETLSELELSQADLQALDMALSEARSQLNGQCEGLSQCMGQGDGSGGTPKLGEWAPGESDGRMGLGSGGPGQGSGDGPMAEADDFMLEKKKATVQTREGPIIGTKLVQGAQIRGESVAEFSEVVEASSQAASEALETMQVQREYHDAVKHYFGTLNAKVKAEQAATGSKDASGPGGT